MMDNKIFSKIFMWMFIGLLITFGVGYYVALHPNMIFNIFGKFIWLFVILELVVVIVLSARIRKLNPDTAKILFCLYSFLTGLTFSSIFIVYRMSSIIFVFLATALVFLIMAVLGYKTNIDLTKFSTLLLVGLLAIIILGIINMFIGNGAIDIGLCIIGVIIFLAFTAYDIQKIKRNLYGLDDERLAILGALELYLDFINIFLDLLRLVGNSRD